MEIEPPTIQRSDSILTIMQEEDYLHTRLRLKLGYSKAILWVIGNAIGMSLYTFQGPFRKVGWLGALFWMTITSYSTIYGVKIICWLCNSTEEQYKNENQEARIQSQVVKSEEPLTDEQILKLDAQNLIEDHVAVISLRDLAQRVGGKQSSGLTTTISVLMIVAAMGTNIGSSIGNVSLYQEVLLNQLKIPIWVSIVVGIVIVLAVLLMRLETERLDLVNTICTVAGFTILGIMLAHSIFRIIANKEEQSFEVPRFNFENSGFFIGVSAYSIEIVDCFVSVRNTSKDRQNFWKPSLIGLTVCAVLYYLTALVFNLSYAVQRGNAYDFYIQDKIMNNLVFVQIFISMSTVIFNTVFISEILEDLPWIRRLLTSQDGKDFSRKKLVLLRAILVILQMVSSYWLKKAERVISFIGSCFSLINSILAPLMLKYIYTRRVNQPNSILVKLHDAILFIVSVGISIIGCIYSFK